MAVATSNPFLALAGQDSDDEGTTTTTTTQRTTTTTAAKQQTTSAAAKQPNTTRGGAAGAQRGGRGGAGGPPAGGRGGDSSFVPRGGRGRGGDFGGGRGGGRGGRGRGVDFGGGSGGGWSYGSGGSGGEQRPAAGGMMGSGAGGEEPLGEDGKPRRMRFNERDRRRGVGTTRHRDFDRHVSAQGKGRGENKKGGGGAHNWGNTVVDYGANDAAAQQEGVEQGSGELAGPAVTTGGWENLDGGETIAATAEAAEGENAEGGEKNRPVEAPRMGYDQWLELQSSKRANLPSLPSTNRAVDKTELEKDGFELHVKEVNRVDGLRGSGLQAPVADSSAVKTDYYTASRRRGGGDALGEQLLNSFGQKSRGRGRGGLTTNSAAPGAGNDGAAEESGAPTAGADATAGHRDRGRKGPRGTPPNLGDETAFPAL